MWEIYGHSGTGQLTDFRILGKDNTYVVGTPLSTPTPCVCGGIIPCDRSMCCLSDDAATDDLHYEKLTLFCFLFWNVSPPLSISTYTRPLRSGPIWIPVCKLLPSFYPSFSSFRSFKICIPSSILHSEPNMGTSPQSFCHLHISTGFYWYLCLLFHLKYVNFHEDLYCFLELYLLFPYHNELLVVAW